MKTDLEIITDYYESRIKVWRQAINDYFERNYGFGIKFYPELEGE